MIRSVFVLLTASLGACTNQAPSPPEPVDVGPSHPEQKNQRVEFELTPVPDELARPVIAELGLDAIGLVAARHRIDPDWHIYWRNPGSSGLPTRLTSTPLEGSTLELGPAIYPAPDRFEDSFGWAESAIVFVPILAGEGGLAVHSKWVACMSDACVSGESEATLDSASAPVDPDDAVRAMLARIPRPLGDRFGGHVWSRTDDRVTLELTSTADATSIELFPDASDPALFFSATRYDPEQHTLAIDWRPGSPGHPLPSSQGVLAWTDAAGTRWFELSVPWPE